VHLHAALLDPAGKVVESFRIPIQGRPNEALAQAFARLAPICASAPIAVGATGIGRDLLRTARGIHAENEIAACGLAAAVLAPWARGIAEVGGHFSKWVALGAEGEVREYALNELCAAGSGAFLEQQAARMELDVENMAALAARAEKGAAVAGRCSVFAKSDMIHLQQKGTPAGEIAYGLCLALVRNYAATVLKGRELSKPIAFVGGCAANAGLLRAFKEVLLLGPEDFRVPERYDSFGAAGAALSAAASAQKFWTLEELSKELAGVEKKSELASSFASLPQPAPSEQERFAPFVPGMDAYIGVDVGSVSTDFVLLDKDLRVVEGVYLPTRGNPLGAMEQGLSILREKTGGNVRVLAVGATGSGRHLAARFLGADTVKNEITAQLKSTVACFPDADTIFEIGGQDSKYVSLKNGCMADFAMNKICAAGTGSFLEEQAGRLGIKIIGEFEQCALSAKQPADLGSRCTVFMDTEMVHALQRGTPVPDIAAGLAYSIANNYLEKVVGHMPVGDCVVFQGGVASNRAVVAAFASILGREIHVHPYNRLSGAIGAALVAAEDHAREPFSTEFVGFDAHKDYSLSSFECRHCSNVCQVNRMERGGRTAFFGDVCERYTSSAARTSSASGVPDLCKERERLLHDCLSAPVAEYDPTPMDRFRSFSRNPSDFVSVSAGRARVSSSSPDSGQAPAKKPLRIGIPRASLYFELFPLWAGMLKNLGCDIVLSEPSSKDLLGKGLRKLSSEACLPVKLGYSHAQDLAQKNVDYIFMPSVLDLPAPFGSPELCSTCPYTQSLPFMVKNALDGRFLVPQVNMSQEMHGLPEGLESLIEPLGTDWDRLRAAYDAGKDAYLEFKQSLLRRGDEFLSSDFQWGVVLIGKPYNVYDSYLNLNLARHLSRLGVAVVPYEFISRVGRERLDDSWDSLSWRFNRDYVKAARAVVNDPRLFPVVVSNFGCGPDAFTVKHLERILEGKPALFLEFDEHRAEAGLVTRLEAFCDEVVEHRRKAQKTPEPQSPCSPHGESAQTQELRVPSSWRPSLTGMLDRFSQTAAPAGRKFFIPYFSDHAHAYCGALRYAGHDALILPETDDATRKKGERVSSGKECHPYSLLAGDLLRLREQMKEDERAVFLFPGTSIPCLLTQYGPGHKLILESLGEQRIEVMTPRTRELQTLLGVQGGVRLWRGLTAMDMLVKASCELRPYELEKGSVDAVHRINCLEVQKAVEGGDILDSARSSVERLLALKIDAEAWKSRRRPLVGVAGDIFTRSNRFANQELFSKLEAMGCEVWPSPFMIDLVDFGLKREFSRNLSRRNLSGLFQNGWLLLLKELSEQDLRRVFTQRFRSAPEPEYHKVLEIAAPYVGERSSQVLMLNTAKMVDFADKGADGIINAMCFNCMFGAVSAAITSRLRGDYKDVPIVNLVFGGTEGSSQSLRLEAFVQQIKRRALGRTRRAGAPAVESAA
jgi:predicted CoA-substrate-specific enzyme activase